MSFKIRCRGASHLGKQGAWASADGETEMEEDTELPSACQGAGHFTGTALHAPLAPVSPLDSWGTGSDRDVTTEPPMDK